MVVFCLDLISVNRRKKMKKVKLMLSLSLMCLSIAVLCFGVLAAQSVSYSISGTISYDVQDVFVEITTKVYKVQDQQIVSTMKTNASSLESKSFSEIDTSTYVLSQELTTFNSTTSETGTSDTIRITYGKDTEGTTAYYTYYIVINIKNLTSSKNITAYVRESSTTNSSNTYTNKYVDDVSSTGTKNIVIACSLKDKKESVTGESVSYTVYVGYVAGKVMLSNGKSDKKERVEASACWTEGMKYGDLVGHGKWTSWTVEGVKRVAMVWVMGNVVYYLGTLEEEITEDWASQRGSTSAGLVV